jgi:hypothetical protein
VSETSNRELDAQVAERVMGCKLKIKTVQFGKPGLLPDGSFGMSDTYYYCECGNGKHGPAIDVYSDRRISSDPYELAEYSESISDAFCVVERMRELGWSFTAVYCKVEEGEWKWSATFGNHGLIIDHRDPSLPLAICKAALEAVSSTNV